MGRSAMTNYRVREHETGAQDFTLYDQVGAYNGTGATLELILTDRVGALVDTTGKANWLVAADGTVRVLPAVDDLTVDRSPYRATFVVTVSGKTYAFPKDAPVVWEVWR